MSVLERQAKADTMQIMHADLAMTSLALKGRLPFLSRKSRPAWAASGHVLALLHNCVHSGVNTREKWLYRLASHRTGVARQLDALLAAGCTNRHC